MKAVRLLQIVIVLAAGAYLVLLHDMNEINVVLPFLFSLPPAAIVVLALLLGWLLGWLPGVVRNMRRNRELARLRRRIAELERDRMIYTTESDEPPVIPDRRPIDEEEKLKQSESYDGHENL